MAGGPAFGYDNAGPSQGRPCWLLVSPAEPPALRDLGGLPVRLNSVLGKAPCKTDAPWLVISASRTIQGSLARLDHHSALSVQTLGMGLRRP